MADVIDFTARSVLPSLRDDGYRCFGLAAAGEREERLFLVFRDPTKYLILAYADLESIGPASGREPNDVAILRFRGTIHREVRIEGGLLMYVVDHVWRRRAICLSETPVGWKPGGNSPFISRINVREFR